MDRPYQFELDESWYVIPFSKIAYMRLGPNHSTMSSSGLTIYPIASEPVEIHPGETADRIWRDYNRVLFLPQTALQTEPMPAPKER